MAKLIEDGVKLLRQLLDCCAERQDPGAMELLHQLLALAPSPAASVSRMTIFDALECSEQETAHSVFLAWLLNPQGPLSRCWLLRCLFEHALPGMVWPGIPDRVEAEVSLATERPDIMAFWSRFTLIIEYKIHSPETFQQVRRYLKTFKIESPECGVLLYVTKYGRWPESVERGDRRVLPVSYEDLVVLIDRALKQGDEPEERGRVLAKEFRNCLAHAVNRSFSMEKPTFSEGTKLLLVNHRKFESLQQIALQESTEFVRWLSREAATRLRPVLGADMQWEDHWDVSTQLEFIYRHPTWVVDGLEFGIGFGIDREKLLSAADFWIGVVIPWPKTGNDEAPRRALSEQLHRRLAEHWSLGELGSMESEWPLWRYAKFDGVEDPYRWGEMVLERLARLAEQMKSHLDDFVTAPAPSIPAALKPKRK